MKARPEELEGRTWKRKTGCGNIYVTVTFDEGKPFELFAHMGKAGGCAASQTEAIGRLVSFAARNGMDLAKVVKHLKGISCSQQTSCADAIGRVLEEAIGKEGDDAAD